ncbi:MAG: DUF58 domain-containing protein [Myxococcota bacterium]|nr:DUF58 domain-containing protein [Myxococcota bacterium]MEC8382042.1 DUF58 domain-containing protein [Myxococcota bacterium]
MLIFSDAQFASTAGIFTALFLLMLVPTFGMLLVATVTKVRRDRAAHTNWTFPKLFASIQKHAGILTARGWGVLWAGVFFTMAAMCARWASLGTTSVFLLLLLYSVIGVSALISTFRINAFHTSSKRNTGMLRREMSPAVVVSGSPAEERFVLDHVPIPLGFLLVIEDKNPPALETESRYAVGVDASGGTTTLQGRLRKTPRGLHELGPANIWYQDILGLTRISVANMATTTLKVLPQFRPLDVIEAPRSEVEEPDILTKPNRFASEDYFLFKEYVSGDDTRRINWRLSIRTGQLQIRKPESKEIHSDTVLLALDAYFPSKEALSDAVGVEQVLDQLVEVWLSLAARMQEKGNHVRLVAYVKQEDGMGIEEVSCALESQTRWQDLGARVFWQADVDVNGLINLMDGEKHVVVVSSRFTLPPNLAFEDAKLLWVYHPPIYALPEQDLTFWQTVVGSNVWMGSLKWLLRLPAEVGNDENTLFMQIKTVLLMHHEYHARRRLRTIAQKNGDVVRQAIVQQSDSAYILELSDQVHRLIGVQK